MDDLKEIKNKHKDKVEKFKLMTKIDSNKLSYEIARNSSLMFYVGCRKADAEFMSDKAKLKLDIVESQVEKNIRAKYSEKKITEKKIESMVKRHPDVLEARNEFIESKYLLNVCTSASFSISQKGDQLTNLAYNYRKELEYKNNKQVRDASINNKFKK